MNITQTAVKRPIATTMVFLIIIVLGIMGFRVLPVDLLPKIEYPQLTVRTNYPNVGPEEIETIITDRIENAVAGVPNVEEIRSRSEEGQSRVTLEFAQGLCTPWLALACCVVSQPCCHRRGESGVFSRVNGWLLLRGIRPMLWRDC